MTMTMGRTTLSLPTRLRDEIKAEADHENIAQWELIERLWIEHKRRQFFADVAAIEFDDGYLAESAEWQDADLTTPANR